MCLHLPSSWSQILKSLTITLPTSFSPILMLDYLLSNLLLFQCTKIVWRLCYKKQLNSTVTAQDSISCILTNLFRHLLIPDLKITLKNSSGKKCNSNNALFKCFLTSEWNSADSSSKSCWLYSISFKLRNKFTPLIRQLSTHWRKTLNKRIYLKAIATSVCKKKLDSLTCLMFD